MARKRKAELAKPEFVNCPFKILIDNQEKLAYTFSNSRSNQNQGNLPYKIETEVRWLDGLGDYSLTHLDDASLKKYGPMPRCIIERKSKSDFFGSMADRENFEERVSRLCEETEFAAVVVEAEWYEIFTSPPEYYDKNGVLRTSNMNQTAIHRTVQSFQMEYKNVHWCFYPGREAAESATFQFLMRFWEHFKKHQLDKDRKLRNYEAYREGIKASRSQQTFSDNPHPRSRTFGDLWDWWNRGMIDGLDMFSQKHKGKTICSEPPEFPREIFFSDFGKKSDALPDSAAN